MKYILSIVSFFIVFSGHLSSQTLEEAKKLYLEGKFAESLPAFEKAVKASPKNASYNQWLGNCLYETGKVDEAEKYLIFAASKNVPEAYKVLGKMYFISYRFEESVAAYESLIEHLMSKKKPETDFSDIEDLLSLSKKAARMLSRCEDIQIIDSLVVDKRNFLKGFPLSEESGSLTEAGDLPGTVVYMNQLKDRRYYAKQTAKEGFRLFSQSALQEKWQDEKMIELHLDSLANDNYPYVLADGVTVYFASTGRGSIGGYDLFTTRYNINNESYLAPEQMGMPFNSLYNDYMLVIDEFNGVGYFASDRFQDSSKVVIYTFIPNDEYKTIASEDEHLLANRAKITSIKDSWKEGANYQTLLRQIKDASVKKAPEKKKDFVFIINDNIIYYSMSDFESDSAKQLFIQSQNMHQQIVDLENELEEQRIAYSKGNKSMSSGIKSGEVKLEKMYDDYRSQVIKARNTEIKYLRQNQ